MKGDLSERDLTLLLNAKGNARWETGEVKENLLALGMSKKAYKWLFSGEGNAEERMQKVRDELGYLNLTDEQIQWILDCIDHASGKIKDVEKNKVPAAKGVSFNIDATMMTLRSSSRDIRLSTASLSHARKRMWMATIRTPTRSSKRSGSMTG